MKKIIPLVIIVLLLSIKQSTGQIAIGYYPFQSELSISSNTEKLIWGDLRIATNTFFGNMTIEPILMANIKRGDWVNYYTGLGANINFFNAFSNSNPINGYTLHSGARIKPLKKHKNIQLMFEISPYMNPKFDGGLLRTRLGVAYQFNKRKTDNTK